MLYLLVAAIAALAAAIAWMWEMKERRMARDPANWPRDLKPERIIKYTRIYLKATGWTVMPPLIQYDIPLRANKKPVLINLCVPERAGTRWKVLMYDTVDRIHRQKRLVGILTQDPIDDDTRAWADNYGFLVLDTSDLPRLYEMEKAATRKRLQRAEEVRRVKEAADSRAAAEAEGEAEDSEWAHQDKDATMPPAMDDAREPDTLPNDRADMPQGHEPASHASKPEGAETTSRRTALAALRAADSAEELLAALRRAQDVFPDQAWPLREAANWAARRLEWQLAADLANRLVQSDPGIMDGYRIGVRGLRALGQHADADALCARAAAQFPGESWPLAEAAQAAIPRAAWQQGIDAAAKLRGQFPAEESGYRTGAFCLMRARQFAEAERVLREAIEKFGRPAWALADYARAARLQTHWHDAIDRWAAYRTAFPDQPEGFVEGAIALRNMGPLDEADALLEQALQHFPDHPGVLEHYARTAQTRGDWNEADRRLQMACAACPDHPQLALWHAEIRARGIFEGRHDWDEAFRRFEALHRRFPDMAEAYSSHIAFLCTARRYDAAREIAALAAEKFPSNVSISLAAAEISEASGAREEAAQLYERAAEAFPHSYLALTRLALLLGKLGRPIEADIACEKAIAQFPTEPDVFRTYAELAILRDDWVIGRDRWFDACRRFPYERGLRKRLHQVQLALADSEDDAGQTPSVSQSVPLPQQSGDGPDAMNLAELVSQFESLAGTRQGCEFGRVQRALGAEPLGLLRWAQMTFQNLLDCLNADFEGVGTPEQTILSLYADHPLPGSNEAKDPEYITRDKKYQMTAHTFVKRSQVPFERMYTQSCRRITFLKRKLMEDLAAGTKIFVFKLGDRALTGEQLEALYEAMRRYGDNTLLYVRLCGSDHPSGSVELVKPGLIVGYIDHFSLADDGLPRTPSIAAWTSICKQAWQLHAGSKRAQAEIACEAAA